MQGAGSNLETTGVHIMSYRDPRHVERYSKLVVRNPDGSTEGKHPRDADVDVMREIHEPAPLLRVIRAKCVDCSGGSESEARQGVIMIRQIQNEVLPRRDRTRHVADSAFRRCSQSMPCLQTTQS
jgi:hypothetical protein